MSDSSVRALEDWEGDALLEVGPIGPPAQVPGQLTLPLATSSPARGEFDGAAAEVDHGLRARMFGKQELARYFGVSVDTIERLVKAGDLPAVRIGSQVRFTLEDVEAFIARRRIKEDRP